MSTPKTIQLMKLLMKLNVVSDEQTYKENSHI